MCGFVALFEPGRRFDQQLLHTMGDDIAHRGPDSEGLEQQSGTGLVFRRLAIMDPQPGADQPMHDSSRRYTLVFNGEIYNFRRLRRELEQAGERFSTNGDSEVLLAAWRHWGEAALDRLEGMFAFVLVDHREGVAWAARDPLGIKPLYLLRRGPLTAFASELRPLRRIAPPEPDPAALAELLVFRFAAGRLSNLRGIDRIPGGTLVRLSLPDGHLQERRYCDPLETFGAGEEQVTEEEAEQRVHEALVRSVEDHLQSDVGYTLQLSGGVDSSLVTAIAATRTGQRLKTFGVHLGDIPQDEARWRELVCRRYPVEHHEIALSNRDYADALPHAVRHMEGPVAHSGCPMLMLLCRRIRKHSPVVLTGEGADELFGGYMRYRLWRELRAKSRAARLVPPALWPLLQRWREVQRYAGGRNPAIYGAVYHDFLALHELFPDLIPAPGQREAVAARFGDFRDQMFAVDQSSYLESVLLRQDKLAMSASVEARVPFTHMPLAREVNSLPLSIRMGEGVTKPLLKRIALRYLPAELVERRKVGLALPLTEWLSDPAGLGRYLDLLTENGCRLAAWCDQRALRRAVERFRAGEHQGLPPLDHLVTMELWLRSLDDASRPGAHEAGVAATLQVRPVAAAGAPAAT